MKTRNIILLVIVLVIIAGGIWGFLLSRRPAPAGSADSGSSNGNFFTSVWPFGNTSQNAPAAMPTPPTNISGYTPPTQTETAPVVNLRKISSKPVAGYGVFMKQRYGASGAETAPYVRYADKATGNIYQTFADAINEREFSSSQVPGLHSAQFGGNGESVIMRYLNTDGNTIETYAGSLPKEVLGSDTTVANNQLTGSFLPENISALSISPDFSKMFYIVPSGNGVAGITADITGNSKAQVFSSPFTEWLTQWPNARMITLTTKPSGIALGYMYAVDPQTKDFTKILGGISGLTTLTSPSGRIVLYADGNLSLKIYNRDSGQTVSAGVNTLPEKCAWAGDNSAIYCAVPKSIQSGLYPDDWYQGTISFSDSIWKIDPNTGNGTLLADPASVSGIGEVDATHLKLDQGANYLFFINKNDSYLYELAL